MKWSLKIKWLLVLVLPFAFEKGRSQVNFRFDPSISVYEGERWLVNAWAGGLNAGQYNRIDFTGDEVEDLIVYDRTGNQLLTFINTDSGYVFDPVYRSYFPDDLEGWVLVRDYDCDGRKDIFTHTARGIRVFRNLSGPGSTPTWELAAEPVLTETSSGLINLQVNKTDIPSIEDIDGDGDLDVLVYNFAIGGFIRHHNNRSIEKYGDCSQLDFELVSRNWGGFEECDCFAYAFENNDETCEDIFIRGRVMHPGGKSLLLIDIDHDGDKDFLGGHEQCNELYFLENVGNSDSARMIGFRSDFPRGTRPAGFPIFPAGYLDDFDGDGLRDLIVAPNDEYNIAFSIDQSNTSWFYKNAGSNELPDFQFLEEDFLQSGMIDIGGNAVPVFIDIDGDRDLDLLVGGNGKNIDGQFYGYLVLYENTGSPINPVFSLREKDYLGASQWRRQNFIPVVADINHDGSMDLVIASSESITGKADLRWLENKALAGEACIFSAGDFESLQLDIDPGDTPEFTDVDKDGLTDVLIGKSTGRLEYHRNLGSDEIPIFFLEDPAFLNIDDDYITFKRNLVPDVFDYDLDGREDLLTSDYTGVLTLYLDFRGKAEPVSALIFNPITAENDSSKLGYHTWLEAGLLYGTSTLSLAAGTRMGGISMYASNAKGQPGEGDPFSVLIYPNPFINASYLSIFSNQGCSMSIFNMNGQVLDETVPINAYHINEVEIGYLPQGIYILKFTTPSNAVNVQKLIYIR